MKWNKTWIAAIASLALGVQTAHAQLAEGVVAVVNDEVISTFDVRQRANMLLLQAGIDNVTPEITRQAQTQALRDLVDESLQLQEAKKFDIKIEPAEIDRRLEDIARSNQSTVDAFTQQLGQAGIGISTLRRQIEADMAWQTLMSGLYRSRVRISPQQIRETKDRLAANAARTHYLISEIFLPAESPQQVADLQRGAMQLLQQLQQGVPFPMIARQFSAAPSASQGGDLGWIAPGELPAQVDAVIPQMQPGQASMPIATDNGVYIVALRDRREGVPVAQTQRVSLRQISVGADRRAALERFTRRVQGCDNLEASAAAEVQGAQVVDLGETTESDLSPSIRDRIANVAAGAASPVEAVGDSATAVVVCRRETGGAGIPSDDELEDQLLDREMSLLSERYLRNLRREATIDSR